LTRVLAVGNQYPPHHFGGYELVWQSAVEHWRAAGHEVRVVASDYRHGDGPVGGAPDADDVHRDLRWYWRDHGFPSLSLSQRLALERHNARILARHLDETRPEVITWWSMGGMSLSLIGQAHRRGVPALGVVHDGWLVYGPQVDAWTHAWRRHGRLAPFVERLTGIPARFDPGVVDEWSFNSEVTRERSLREGLDPDRTSVLPPGIDDHLFTHAPPRDWSWQLGYVGRVESTKGIDTAIRALSRLPADATLTVVGDGDDVHLAELRELAATSGVGPRVSFAPGRPRAQLPATYASFDTVLFPVTWEEPWGLVPLEAMAVGRPVVATGTGGSREYLRHEENCLLFQRGDADELAAAITRLAQDASLRETLRAGGAAAAQRHTEDGFNAELERHLRRVASGERP
jgi:glycosyltransferase involved in cell wall biosynthesis